MSKVITMCMISGDPVLNKLAHCFDLFERRKMLATPKLLHATCQDWADPVAVCNHAKESALKTGLPLAAVFIPGTSIGWINPDVVLVSDGEQFTTLQYWLDYYGYRQPAPEPEYAI